ncbi:hypothetical protein SUNI508_01421 [Seiridium unicorne]|uniref:Uncharacterized protein n=1 Tax=Seiridium unicorne TaxID=138068 RepID=A0ABR2USP3_9PEZI
MGEKQYIVCGRGGGGGGGETLQLPAVWPIYRRTHRPCGFSSLVSYLCGGFDTPSDEVFFLKEFRDDSSTTKSTREEYARAAILNHLNQSRQSGRNEDVIWTFPPEKDFANEILSGIALYNISGHRGALEAVRHKTTNALNDGHLPIEQNENVRAILNWHKYLKNTTFDVERAL